MVPRYEHEPMSLVWSDKHKYCTWLNIEYLVLKSSNERRVVDADIPVSAFTFPDIDIFIAECKKEEETTQHDVVAFLNVLERKLGYPGRFIHYGMTSSDLVDTTFALQLVQSLHLVASQVQHLQDTLEHLAVTHKNTLMIGRTHGQYAEPTTFGLVLLSFFAELRRHRHRLDMLMPHIAVGKISGAVGTYAHIPPTVEADVMKWLALRVDDISTQIVSRDRHAEVFCVLAQIGNTLEKLATQIRLLSRSDVNEVAEGHGPGYKGSSSMPHKTNPIACENICGLSRVLRGYMMSAMEDVALWHERDISHSSTERIVAPDAFGLLYHMLHTANKVMQNLWVNKDLMRERVEQTRNQWASQYWMLSMLHEVEGNLNGKYDKPLKGMSRQQSHAFASRLSKDSLPHQISPVPLTISDMLPHVDHIFERVLGY